MSTRPITAKSGDGFVLASLKRYGLKAKYCAGAPAEPARNVPAFLDHLDRYAVEISLGHPEAPKILRQGERFVFNRRERRMVRYVSIRTVLRKLFFEMAMKDG